MPGVMHGSAAVVLAAGQGRRMGGEVPKQYMPLCGIPLAAHALLAFEKSRVEKTVLVVPANDEEYAAGLLKDLDLKKLSCVVGGGKERYHSVYAGLMALPSDCQTVLIHDGARAMAPVDMIDRALECAAESGACVCAVPVKDTLRFVGEDGKFLPGTPDRSRIYSIQTPQGFAYEKIVSAYNVVLRNKSLCERLTDDAMVLERAFGESCELVFGSYENIKVTTPEDMLLAEMILRGRKETDAAGGRA